MTISSPRVAGRNACLARALLCMAALLSASVFTGCEAGGQAGSAPTLYARLVTPYRVIQLGRSTSLEVLNVAQDPVWQSDRGKTIPVLLTQGDTVIGYSGRSENTRRTWLNIVAFDEFRMTARRKYFFCSDERFDRVPDDPKRRLFPRRKGILFDAEFIIDPEVLTTPYATAEAQRIEILRWLAGQFRRDLTTLVGDPKNPAQGDQPIQLSGMMVSQVFQAVLAELGQSPGLAKNLPGETGIDFPHISLNKGHVRLITQNDLGAVKIRVNLPMTKAKR